VKRRPLRLGMEAKVLMVDLALGMASHHIGAAKARAMAILCKAYEAGDLSVEEGGKNLEGQQHEAIEIGEEVGGERWEDLAKEALIGCLSTAKDLTEAGREAVLTETVKRVDWLGLDEQQLADENDAIRSKHTQSSFDSSNADSDSQSEVYTEMSSSGGSDENHGHHPCPLRTLFRMHDRYEELRLGHLVVPASNISRRDERLHAGQ